MLAPDGVTIGQLFVVIVAPLARARIVANLAGNLEFIDNHPRVLIRILDISFQVCIFYHLTWSGAEFFGGPDEDEDELVSIGVRGRFKMEVLNVYR